MTDEVRRPRAKDRPFNPNTRRLVALEQEIAVRREARESRRLVSLRELAEAETEEVTVTPENERLSELEKRLAQERAASEEYLEKILRLAPWSSLVLGPKGGMLKEVLLHHTRRRRFERGELILRQGDYGNSAFFVLSGSVQVVLELPDSTGVPTHPPGVSKEVRKVGWWQAFKRWWRSPGREHRDLSVLRQEYLQGGRDIEHMPIFVTDVPRVIEHNRTVQLGPGELFGEIAAVSRMPRSATVFAESEGDGTELLEIRWQGLHKLIRQLPEFKEHVYLIYRRNSLRSHLLATPFLQRVGLTPSIAERVRKEQLWELFVEDLGWESLLGESMQGSSVVLPVVFQLRVLTGPQADDVLVLYTRRREVVVGRREGADLRILADKKMSRKHAVLRYDDDKQIWYLGNRSQYGTRVDGHHIRAWMPLQPGQTVRMGDTALIFELTPSSLAELEARLEAEQTYEVESIARLEGTAGVEIRAYTCKGKDGLPDASEREGVHKNLSQKGSSWSVIVFTEPRGEFQVWRWRLPLDLEEGAQGVREVALATGDGPPETLARELFRTLLLERIARDTEFNSFGEFAWTLAESAPEPVIASEGSYPNGVVLMRTGFARLSERTHRSQRTLQYLHRGDSFGVAEIASNWLFRQELQAKEREPVAFRRSLHALGYVDALFLPTPTLERFVLPAYSEQELRALAAPPPPAASAVRGDEGLLEFLTERRLYNGTAAMVLDLDRCTRCDDCVRACASAHFNNPRFLRHGPTYGNLMIANACMHCADPVCMIGCPTGAIHRSVSGEVVIDDPTCIGCSTCAHNCPYHNIRMVEIRNQQGELLRDGDHVHQRATKCDLCYDQPGGPACVRACPHDALARIDLTDLHSLGKWPE